jgi:hypothetical protein
MADRSFAEGLRRVRELIAEEFERALSEAASPDGWVPRSEVEKAWGRLSARYEEVLAAIEAHGGEAEDLRAEVRAELEAGLERILGRLN